MLTKSNKVGNITEMDLGRIKLIDMTYSVSLLGMMKSISLTADIDLSTLNDKELQVLLDNNQVYDEVAATQDSTTPTTVVLQDYELKVFYMKVVEISNNGNTRERILLTGLNATSAHRAYEKLKSKPVELDDIAVMLEDSLTHPIPNPVEFDNAVKKQIRKTHKIFSASMHGIKLNDNVLDII